MKTNRASGSFASVRPAVIGLGRVLGMGISAVAAAPLSTQDHGDGDMKGTPIWVLAVASMVLVLLGGAFAGLTIAYVRPLSPYTARKS